MNWISALLGLAAVGYVAWEFVEPWRRFRTNKRRYDRQVAAWDRDED